MTIITAALLLILTFVLVTSFYLLLQVTNLLKKEKPEDDHLNEFGFSKPVRLAIALALVIILISIPSPFIFIPDLIKEGFSNTTGYTGDTIGGIMSPFIALSSVIITGLAFYVQHKANEQQKIFFTKNKQLLQDQINIQKFESQFYEMLKIHRENINEMKIEGYDFEETSDSGEPNDKIFLKRVGKSISGRKVFVSMITEFECILSIFKMNNSLNKENYNMCYYLFFFGLDGFKEKYPNEVILKNHLSKARKQHSKPNDFSTNMDRKKYVDFSSEEHTITTVKLNFNYKPFSGHSSRLGHYFRHLHMSIKSIVNANHLKYEDKMNYLNILRAQLSNQEQILLFYNWLGGFGEAWENDTNKFFTEYSMIHNLVYNSLYPDTFIKESVKELKNKKVELRQGEIFEIDG